MKKIFKLFVVALIAVTFIMPTTGISAAAGDPVDVIRSVTRSDGGGAYGTHKNPSYKEGDTQYYRDGDIIEVDIKLPPDTGTQFYQQVIRYDQSKLDLLSSNADIRQSLDSHFRSIDWSVTAARFNGNSNEIHVFGGSNYYPDLSSRDYDGGTLAKIYFKVKDGVETTDGEPLTFDFFRFQAATSIDGKMTLSHVGYDASRDSDTAFYTAPSQTVYVKKPSTEFNAEDGFITQTQAKALNTQSDLKVYNNASAKLGDGTVLDVTTTAPSFSSIKAGTLGSYDVTYGYSSGDNTDSKTVKLNVISDDAIISPEKTFSLSAVNGFLSETQAKALVNESSLINVNKAGVMMKDGTAATPSVSAPSFAAMKAGTLGTYEVTYSYVNGSDTASKKVYVNVVKDGSIISPDYSFSLYAENGFIKDNEAKALVNKGELVPYNKAEVTLSDGTKVAPNVTVTATEWISITSGTKGSYTALYQYGSGSNEVSTPAKITVIDANAPISPDGKASLDAQDIELSETEAKALTSQTDLIALTKAAVTLSDGSTKVPTIKNVNFADIKAGTVGTYPITYTYGTGDGKVEKTVNVKVAKDKKHTITLEDKIITQDQAKALSVKEELRSVNNVVVTAIDGTNPNAVVTAPNWAAIKAGTLGEYTVTYSYGYGDKLVSESAKVIIVENGSEINDRASLYAQNGFMEQSSAKALLAKNDLIPYNNAKVTLLNGGSATPTAALSAADWHLLSAGELGSYNVGYTYDTLSKSVLATVIKDGSIISEDKTTSLYAENAFIQSKDAKKLTSKESLRSYNKATVTLINGVSANATVDIATKDWLAIQQGTVGSYDVLYTYGSGNSQVSKKVKIVVLADDPVISEDGKVALNATDGEIADSDAKKIIAKEDLISYNDANVTLEDGTKVAPNVSITSASLDAIKAGTLGTYTVVYTYGTEGTKDFVSKSVTLQVVKKTEERLLFDYDKNGRIDILDLAEMNRIFSKPAEATAVEMLLSDANNDGRIDILDLAECKYYVSSPVAIPPTVLVPIG